MEISSLALQEFDTTDTLRQTILTSAAEVANGFCVDYNNVNIVSLSSESLPTILRRSILSRMPPLVLLKLTPLTFRTFTEVRIRPAVLVILESFHWPTVFVVTSMILMTYMSLQLLPLIAITLI